ncbi:hypothetical protein ACSBR1_032575 [Camellia fascicularis]
MMGLCFLNLNLRIQKDSVRMVREYYKESNDIDGTLKQLPRYMVDERATPHFSFAHLKITADQGCSKEDLC